MTLSAFEEKRSQPSKLFQSPPSFSFKTPSAQRAAASDRPRFIPHKPSLLGLARVASMDALDQHTDGPIFQ